MMIKFKNKLMCLTDFILLVFVILGLMNDSISIIGNFFSWLFEIISFNDIISNMTDYTNTTNFNSNSNSNSTIIYDDGNWSNTIRSIFIYNWQIFWKSGKTDTVEIEVSRDNDTFNVIKEISTSSSSTTGNKFLPDTNNLEELSNMLLDKLVNSFSSILAPVEVSYSKEVLANQIHGIAILLYITSLLILFLIIGFMLNVFIYIYSETLINYFNNKYIKWYLNFNKKLMGIELFFLGSSILYFMYMLSNGIKFIAIHPIIF